MGMSGATYMSRSNEITKEYYHHLLSVGHRDRVYTRVQQDGQTIYFTQ